MIPAGWNVKELFQISEFKSGGTPSKNNNAFWDGNIPWITVKDMKSFEISDSLLKITEEGVNNGTTLVDKDTLLVLVRGMALKNSVPVCITTQPSTFNQDIKAVLPKGINPRYLGYYLISQGSKLQKLVDEAGHGTGRLQTDLLSEYPILIPPVHLQDDYTSIIDLWGYAIEILGQLIEKKSLFLRGLRQKLLFGKQRLQKFKNNFNKIDTKLPSDWTYPMVKEVASEISIKNKNGELFPVLSCTKHHGLVDSLSYFGKQVFSKDTSTYKIVARGQFAYATNHIEEGSIGYQNRYDKAVISPMYTVFETNDTVDDRFLFLLLKTERYRRIFESRTSASVNRRGSLRWKDFSKIHIPLPPLKEQKAIVATLDIFEQEIDLLKKKLEALKRQKHGLMQKLLTGKIPVKEKRK